MIETKIQALPHGIDLSIRACGERGRPVLMFLHGFPEAAFVWDEYLEYFAKPEHGGYRTVAPNLRGFERSSSPTQVSAYRAKHLVQDIAALIAFETSAPRTDAYAEPANPAQPLACLIAHDWGGAVAWNLVNQQPHLQKKLVIINSPHPGTFLRELQHSPKQQTASLYMNFLARSDAPSLLAEDDFRRLWEFFTTMSAGADRYNWLTPSLSAQYRAVWRYGLTGGCNYYAASPMRPDENIKNLTLASDLLKIQIPTQVIWGMGDIALRPELLDGLQDYILDLRIKKINEATHWITHEQPARVKQLIVEFLQT